jgi:hypothetical protein
LIACQKNTPDPVTNLQYMADGMTFQRAVVSTHLEGSATLQNDSKKDYTLNGIGLNTSGRTGPSAGKPC